jgi:hypothetical protein
MLQPILRSFHELEDSIQSSAIDMEFGMTSDGSSMNFTYWSSGQVLQWYNSMRRLECNAVT